MEDHPLRFENKVSHQIQLKDRKILELSGVKQIESFDSNEFLMETSQGWLLIEGRDLSLGKLDTNKQEVSIQGNIDAMRYVEHKNSQEKSSWIAKIFK